jgi:hypothetical protein
MTGLRIASLFVAVVAGDYAALMLIDGQLIDFGVAAAICAGSSVAAGLIAYADDEDARRQHELGRGRRKAVARGRAAVWERRDQQAATAPDQGCPLCGVARQTLSDSSRFVDRPGAPRKIGDEQIEAGRARAYAGHARRPSTQSRHDLPAAGGQGARLCGACASALNPESTRWPVAGLGAGSDG